MVQEEAHIYEGYTSHIRRITHTINNDIGKMLNFLIEMFRKFPVLIMCLTFTNHQGIGPK